MKNLDVEFIRNCISYNPKDGSLKWLYRDRSQFKSQQAYKAWNTKYKGKVALETLNASGYRHGTINSTSISAHKVAWAIAFGYWPINQIDHINRDRSDNRLENLRLANKSENQHNRSKSKNNTSGFKCVTFDKRNKKWDARIGINNQVVHLGRFFSAEDAHLAYVCASKKYHLDFARAE